jgi:hypothetical protein
MGFFNKILVRETKTGNLIDITNLDLEHYESFLTAIQKLEIAYILAKKKQNENTKQCNVLSINIVKFKKFHNSKC